jgi:tetratricopeptide (TPR) repeat protein
VRDGSTVTSSLAVLPFGIGNPAARDYVERAREFLLRFNQRDNDAGLDLLRQALELDPTYPDAHAVLSMALAMRYWQIGDRGLLGSAIAVGRRAIALDPNLAGAYSSLGWALDHGGDREAALQAHRQAVKLSPDLSDGLAVLQHWSFGRLDEAARWWAPALARNPTNTNTYWHAGKTYLCLGILPRARELLAKSVAFEPSFAWAHYSLTLAFLREGNLGQARAQIERMIATNQEDATALTLAGMGALAMAEPAVARGYFERGLPAAPAYVKRHGTVGLAWILQHSGEEERARDLVRDALRQFEQFWGGQPTRPEDFMDLARIKVLQGNREEALQLMETAVGLGWRFVYHQPNVSILQSLQGDPRYDDVMASVHADIERMRTRVETEGW